MRFRGYPSYQKADACGHEARAETAVEPREELLRNARDVLEADPQGDHECNDDVSLEAEGPEDASPLVRQRKDAGGVPCDDLGEHQIEAREHQDRQRHHPPKRLQIIQQQIMTDARNGNLCADGRPEETIDSEEMPCANLEHSVR